VNCPPLTLRIGRAHRRCAEKVARGETSGTSRPFFNRGLEVRGEFCARLQRAGTSVIVIQTFHVWLPSARRSAAERSRRFTSGYLLLAAPRRNDPDVSRLATFCSPLRGGTIQTFHVWLPSTRRSAAERRRFTSGYLLLAAPRRK
jgi:hypothetical protein